jgi:DNA N-6-adenine-methyltransferase (Dam)
MRHIVSSESAEWFTPSVYIEAARRVMGGIDLDPASCELANRTVKAAQFFNVEENGLVREWFGKVFLNPPYRRDGIQGKFVDKLVCEYKAGRCTEAIILVGNRTECDWFAPLWEYPMCFTNHRIRFVSPVGEKDSPVNANVFAYLGRSMMSFSNSSLASG